MCIYIYTHNFPFEWVPLQKCMILMVASVVTCLKPYHCHSDSLLWKVPQWVGPPGRRLFVHLRCFHSRTPDLKEILLAQKKITCSEIFSEVAKKSVSARPGPILEGTLGSRMGPGRAGMAPTSGPGWVRNTVKQSTWQIWTGPPRARDGTWTGPG